MSDNRKMLNFRCPLDVLEAIDTVGRERYPAENENGCDRSKTLLELIQLGIQAIDRGDVLPVSKTSDVDEAITKLAQRVAEVEARLGKLKVA